MRPAVQHALLLAVVIGGALAAYANSFHAPFLLDNEEVILEDARVHAATPEHVQQILTDRYWAINNTGLYRPLPTLSFLLNYAGFGDGADPPGYHWFNFLLHALNIVLVYALGLAVFDRIPAALLLSAFWGLHPVLTESVTNIVGRADMLAAFSVLAAVLCHRKALDASGVWKGLWLTAIALAATIGVFSKESAIGLVAMLAIYDFTLGRSASWRSRLPSYVAAVVPCLVYLYVRSRVFAGASPPDMPYFENPLLGAGFWTARITAIKVIGRYLGLLVWPARLSWDYGFNEIPLFGWRLRSWEDWKAVAALAGCAAAAVIALRSWRSRKPVLFGVAFFFAAILPVSNLLIRIGTIMAERFLYLPSVGFAVVAVWVLETLRRRLPAGRPAYRHVAGLGLGVLLIAMATRTYARNGDWLDPQRFWLSGVAAAPGSFKTNLSAAVGTDLASRADAARSIGYADRALAILDPLPDSQNSPVAYRYAGIFYRHLGDLVASKDAAVAAAAGPDPQSWYRKSLAAQLRGERIELLVDERYRAENARLGKPGLTSVPGDLYLELGRAYLRLSDTPHALAALERGRTLESIPDLLNQLASLYRAGGEPHKAALALMESMAADPNQPQVAPALVELYGQIDPNGCAILRQGGGASPNPDCPLVHNDICAATRNLIGNYLRRGRQSEAASVRNSAEQDMGCAPGLLN